jgi:Rieske Fe-S protein
MDEQRRRFCQVAGLTLVGAAALPGCGDSGGAGDGGTLQCSSTAISAGIRIGDVQPNTATLYAAPDTSVFICRDDRGIYAVDAGCTHLGCDVEFVSAQEGFKCPCHLATFSFNGENPTGLAPTPLPHYLVCTTVSGVLVIDTQQVVPANTRYKP